MNDKQHLKRSINTPLLTLYGLGTILGAGIYVLVGKVAGISGMYTPIAFLLAAILATFTGLSYAELSSRYPRSAGEAIYVYNAFHIPFLSAVVGWLIILTGVVSAATIANGFVGYLSVFITVPDWIAITLLILVLSGLACWGISESVSTAAIVTAIELGGLFLILFYAGGELQSLPDRVTEFIPTLQGEVWLTIMLGAFLSFYAFIGFEDMVNVAEEVIEPQRTLPIAIISALIISTILYVLIALVAVAALPLIELQHSDAPMASILQQYSENAGTIITIISLIAVINGALVQIIMGSRVLYGMGRQQLAPAWFGHVSSITQTPISATVVIAMLVLILAIALPLVALAKITSFIIIAVFCLVNVSLFIIKIRIPSPAGTLKLNKLIPLSGALLCMAFLIIQSYYLFSGAVIGGH